MIRRIVSLLLLIWLVGFVWFAIVLPGPHENGKSDAVVVLTGGGGRIGRGLEALEKGWARRMLVSGVDREVRPGEFAGRIQSPARADGLLRDAGLPVGRHALQRARGGEMGGTEQGPLGTAGHDRLAHAPRRHGTERADFPKHVALIRDAVPSQPKLPHPVSRIQQAAGTDRSAWQRVGW